MLRGDGDGHFQFDICILQLHLSVWVCPECTQVMSSSPILFFFFTFHMKERPDALWRTRALVRHLTPKYKPAGPGQMSLVLAPRARSPSVEKKSSISFSRSRLRFSASSRARSEFRSLISSMRCFFLSCSISCSRRSICAHRAALDSSSLRGGSTTRTQAKGQWLHLYMLDTQWRSGLKGHRTSSLKLQKQRKQFSYFTGVWCLLWFWDAWIEIISWTVHYLGT